MEKKFVYLVFLSLFPFFVQSQGYRKFYKPPGYTFRSPIALQVNESGTTGFFMYSQSGKTNVEIASIDSLGNETVIHSVANDSTQSSVGTALQANHTTTGHLEGQEVFIIRQSMPLKLKVHVYFPETRLLTSYEFDPPVPLVGFRPFNIIKVDDGYLITGDWVLQSEHPRGFIVALNKDFSLRYWKWYSTPYPLIEIYGAIEEDEYYLLYGYISLPSGYSWVYYRVLKENGNIIDQNVIDLPHCYRLYSTVNSNYVGIALTLNQDKTSTCPSWVLLDENFHVLKQTEFGIRFYKIQRLYGLIEFPYHSTRDTEGNYVIATQQVLPIDLELYPFGPFTEVLCLTKINPHGDVLWETRDSVMYYPDFDAYGVGKILGLNTGPNGEIYVYGNVDDLDTTINQYKSVGYIFQYDKHGCRIENCRSVSTENTESTFTALVYPNPFHDQLTIDSPENAFLRITDLSGSVLSERDIFHGKTTLETTSWNQGMYIVSLQTEQGKMKSFKVVKM